MHLYPSAPIHHPFQWSYRKVWQTSTRNQRLFSTERQKTGNVRKIAHILKNRACKMPVSMIDYNNHKKTIMKGNRHMENVAQKNRKVNLWSDKNWRKRGIWPSGYPCKAVGGGNNQFFAGCRSGCHLQCQPLSAQSGPAWYQSRILQAQVAD